MSKKKQILKSACVGQESDRGAAIIEMALAVALVAVIGIVSIRVVGQKTSQKFSDAGCQLEAAGLGGGGEAANPCLTVGTNAD